MVRYIGSIHLPSPPDRGAALGGERAMGTITAQTTNHCRDTGIQSPGFGIARAINPPTWSLGNGEGGGVCGGGVCGGGGGGGDDND